MNTRLKVSETLAQDPLFVAPDLDVRSLAKTLAEHDTGSALVGANGRAEGIVTERDIVRRVVARGKDPAAVQVHDIMTTELVTIGIDEDIVSALQRMRALHVRRLPVVSADRVVGMTTERAIAALAPELIQIADDWGTIHASGEESSMRPIYDEEEPVQGQCERCGNMDADLVELDGDMLCPDCLEATRQEASPNV